MTLSVSQLIMKKNFKIRNQRLQYADLVTRKVKAKEIKFTYVI